MSTLLGIDIGGTAVKIGVVDEKAKFCFPKRAASALTVTKRPS